MGCIVDKRKADALLSAAQAGNVVKVRELLAAGPNIEAADVNRMTPAMLAAQGGHVEAFQALVEAGADLHALAFRQVDLLEMAARGGNAAIVRYLLERGLPVNGHWQPTVDALRKIGHESPLMQAATNGHVEAVRVLLQAGADQNAKYQGKTVLQQVEERLRDPDYADWKQQHREIAALLKGVPAVTDPPAQRELREVEKFAKNAQRPGYEHLHQQLAQHCGDATPWQPLPDHGLPCKAVLAFRLTGCKQLKTLEDLQEQARKASCHLILAEPWAPGEDALLALFPTDDKLAVVAAIGTEGANYGVRTADAIAWLENLEKENPFQLVLCNHESIGGAFLGPVKRARKLAEQMVEFCPSCLDESIDDAGALAIELKKRRTFLLRWD